MPLILTNERVNRYGFRVLSKGGDVEDFLKNPVLLYDHARRDRSTEDIILPIGKINNLRLDDAQWLGDPEFDQDDDFAKKIARKFEKGYLNACSIGFDIIEMSEDPDVMLPGQKYPTITKWALVEVSITDIPANADSCKLSHNGKTIHLNAKNNEAELQNFFSNNKSESIMKKTIAVLNGTKLVSLPETATDELVEQGVQVLVGQLSAKDQEIQRLKTEVSNLQSAAADAQKNALKDKAQSLVEGALSAKKIVASQKDAYVALASASEDGYTNTKNILDAMKGYESVNGQLKAGETSTLSVEGKSKADLIKMWDEAHKSGTLEELKANVDVYKAVYKAKFGKEAKI